MGTGAAISVTCSELCFRLRKVRVPYVGPILCGANDRLIYSTGQCIARVLITGFAVISSLLCFRRALFRSSSALISCLLRLLSFRADNHLYILRTPSFLMMLILRRRTLSQQQILSFHPAMYVFLPLDQETIKAVTQSFPLIKPAFCGESPSPLASGLVRLSRGCASLTAYNTTPEPLLLPEGSLVAILIDVAPV